MIRNIIFDIGNVLSDFSWKPFLEEQGFSPELVERIAAASVYSKEWNELDRGVWTYEEIIDSFVGNDPEIEEQIRKAFVNVKGMVRLREYAIPWVKQLKEAGYGVYYLSNFSYRAEHDCPDSLAFIPLMDGGILSYKDKMTKPEAAIYELLLSRYGLKAEECVFLDDTLKNVEGARNCGIAAIRFQSKEQAEEELRNLGVKY